MYLFNVRVQNVRSLRNVTWEIDKDDSKAPGWHVILGDNGSGKSSFIRSVALALVGPSEALALRQDWNEWLRKDQDKGSIRLTLDREAIYDLFSGHGNPSSPNLHAGLNFVRQENNNVALTKAQTQFNPERYIWGGKGGWFSASYGPFRRFQAATKTLRKSSTRTPN